MPEFRVEQDSLQHRFLNSRAKVQIFGGGFANGKTSASVIKALELARAYPGSNGLIARETYPKLNDTIRKEFLKWCPPKSIKSFPMSQNASNTCTLTNGTTINFRYIAQQNKQAGQQSTSNLLSATYDWIVIDQIEDPGITYKDFLDLIGRLRGNTPYRGEDGTMPRTGPGWLIITCNPTRNWVYTRLVRPLHLYKKSGLITDDLLCLRNPETKVPLLDADGKPFVFVELFEGATYENKANLREDFIQLLESSYRGQMRERFLLGEWAAFEGLVYPQFDETVHCIPRSEILGYLATLVQRRVCIRWLEGYDYGIASPSCYLLYFVDDKGNVFCVDGFYQAELSISEQQRTIQMVRARYGVPYQHTIMADPSTLKRSGGAHKTVGKTIAELFARDEFGQPTGIQFIPGNNDIKTGIAHVGKYLAQMKWHVNPFTGEYNSPHFFFAHELGFIVDEFGTYTWKLSPSDERMDVPNDKLADHAMDNLKYVLSSMPNPAAAHPFENRLPAWMTWQESDQNSDPRRVRYG